MPQALLPRPRRRNFRRRPRLQGDGLLPPTVLGDPAQFPDLLAEGLVDRLPGAKGPHPNRVAAEVEQAILDYALAHPCHGAICVEHDLQLKGLQISSSCVGGVGLRHGLLTKHELLLRLEKSTAECKVELTEEQVHLLERCSPEFQERQIEIPHAGSIDAVDTFFVGALKRVGKVYLQTAIDCHSRYAWTPLYPSKLPVTQCIR